MRLLFFLFFVFWPFAERVFAQPLVINEVMASNQHTLADAAGDYDDWVEVFNGGASPVQMAGMYWSDNPRAPFKWRIPADDPAATEIQPGGYLLFWFDGRPEEGVLHTSFKLNADGEHVSLYGRDSVLVDSVSFVQQMPDQSLGRLPNGNGGWFQSALPSPRAENGGQPLLPRAPAPQFSQQGGFYPSGLTLHLSSTLEPSVIRYTTDGSIPDSTDLLYQNALFIEKNTVMRARVFAPGRQPGPVATQTFLVRQRHLFPVVTLSVEPEDFFNPVSGIYANALLFDEERPVHICFFETTGSTAFEADMRAELHGTGSLANSQRSLLLKANGDPVEYAIFPDMPQTSYRRLVLRNSGQDWNVTMLRDAYVSDLGRSYSGIFPILDTLHLLFQAYRPTVVYINGQYWGIHNLHEQAGPDLLHNRYRWQEQDVDFIDLYAQALSGDDAEWRSFWQWVSANRLTSDAALQTLESKMDMDNFIDYAIFQIATDNVDWPLKNWRRFRPRTPEARWQWLPFDFDLSFGLLGTDGRWNTGYAGQNAFERAIDSTFRYPSTPDWATLFLRRCVEHRSFQHRFLNRTADLLNTVFESQRTVTRLAAFRSRYQPEMGAHFERWAQGGFGWEMTWEENIQKMRAFAEKRPAACFEHAVRTFNKTTSGTTNVTLEVQPPEAGSIRFSTLSFSTQMLPWTGTYFRDIPIPIAAVAHSGWRFKGWSHQTAATEAKTYVRLNGSRLHLTAYFEPVAPGGSTDTSEAFDHSIRIAPQPAYDALDVTTRTGFTEIRIFTVDGCLLDTRDYSATPLRQTRIPTDQLYPGAYLLSMRFESGKTEWKLFLKQNR